MNGCPEWADRLQALVDGELDASHAMEVEAHIAGCGACAEARTALLDLRAALRSEGVRAVAPRRLMARLDAAVHASTERPARRVFPVRERAAWSVAGAGLAIAACAVLAIGVAPSWQTASLERDLVAGHIRSEMAQHLTDVQTSDQHVVKPWFDGKVDFAPPVIDLADQGFPIVGGRLDYIDQRTVAALVYRRGRHIINLFVWPDRAPIGPPEAHPPGGYTLVHWARGGMTFWAVSDVNEADLRAFQRLLEARMPS
ncbi:MAG TPA: zf-HC2 domain-containing protein [Caulobacteraceae bacterium]|nr:zf-HC2 domain-containing protein [Caulobacteraceae bacterium]